MKGEEGMRILTIEDDEPTSLMVKMLLEREFGATVDIAADCATARERLSSGLYGLITIDYRLPDIDGLSLLEEIMEKENAPPVIILTGQGSEQAAVSAFKLGASSYVVKDAHMSTTLITEVRWALVKAKLKGTEEALRASEGRLRLINDIAVRFLGINPEELGEEIVRALADIAALVGADRCFIYLGEAEVATVYEAYEWHREGLQPLTEGLQKLDLQPMPWLRFILQRRLTVSFSSLGELPGEAALERAIWGAAGIKSLLGVLLFPDKRASGFLGLTSELAERRWRGADEGLLREVGNVLSSSIARVQAEEEIGKLSRRVMEEHEETKRKIAVDLHDEFGQSLLAFKLELDVLRKEAGGVLGDQAERLEGMGVLLEDTIEKIRNLYSELHPFLLDELGLGKALEINAEGFSRKSGVTARVDCAEVTASLSGDAKQQLFCIAREALANIARHACATEAELSLASEDGMLILTASDNGKGFEVGEVLRRGRQQFCFGLLGMRERTRFLGGEFEISSKPGKGTTVVVKVPLES